MTTYFYKHTNELQKYTYLSSYFFFSTLLTNYWFCDQWIYLLLKPLFEQTTNHYLIVTEITEIFFIKLVLTFFVSCCFTIIFIFIQIWMFLSPGLFKLENYSIIKWYVLFIINLTVSIYITIIFVIPTIWIFFIEFLNNPNTYLYNYFLEPKLSTYLYFIIKILISIILICQYPLIIVFCLYNNFLKINSLIKFRKILYLAIYFVTALISPPNIEIQFLLTFFFCLILELIILLFIMLNNKSGL